MAASQTRPVTLEPRPLIETAVNLTGGIVLTLLFVAGAPIFVLWRREPLIKYRAWTLNLVIAVVVAINRWLEFVLGLGGPWQAGRLQTLLIFKNALAAITFPVFHAVFLKHYFLLRLASVQQDLLSLEPTKQQGSDTGAPIVDLSESRRVQLKNKLRFLKRLSREATVWLVFYLPNALTATTITTVFLQPDVDAYASGASETAQVARSGIYLFEMITAALWACYYLPRAPDDGLYMKSQFFLLTLFSTVNMIESVALGLFKSPTFIIVDRMQVNRL
ncbi:hypothetical protein HK105_203451 [Polyrhizophydium stewartii]|uniref:Uncharacterized protein n=1 Tax=Polyrhizophydium stewartii TaxID=2732419 RepID=A0ABR4NBV4_9FUNG